MAWLISCFEISFKVISFVVIFGIVAFMAAWLTTLVIAIISALYKTFFEK